MGRGNSEEQEAPVIYWRINEWFKDLSPEIKTRLKIYHDDLLKFNRTLNLISPKTLFVADAVHFANSLMASHVVMKSNPSIDKIYDLGSGNGFPGLVFAIMFPKVQVVLVESDSKKCEFLKHMSSALKLQNVIVQHQTIESLPENAVKFAMCRGFSSISKTILTARKFMVKGGALYHLKGEEWGIEVGEIPTQLCSIWTPSLIGEYKLPVGEIKFAIVRTDKIS